MANFADVKRIVVFRLRLLLAAVAAVMLAACASMGRPEGGPKDYDPPLFVRSSPAPSALNVSGNKINIYFNENVQLEDPTTKVVVSPAQKNQPVVSASGRRVTVELRDTLIPNTTYTIDFADAIADLNEKNVLDGFAIDFATGPSIDSLRISGMVLEARNLEPAQGILVGVYSNLSDTALTTLPFERITKTNQLGQFTLRNLKPGTYRIFAVKDQNRDYHWDRSEDVAFFDTTITPTSERVMVNDTLAGADGSDSIVAREITVFHPNNILLTWFNEDYKAQYLMNNKRTERNRLYFEMGAPSDTLPRIRPLNGPREGQDISRWAVLEASPTRDTLNYWITDSAVILQDSLLIGIDYLRTDSLDRLVWTTDTLRMFMRPSKVKQEKKKEKDEEEADSVPRIEFLELTSSASGVQDINRGITLTTTVPIARLDTAAIHLETLVDTVWTATAPPRVVPAREHETMVVTLEKEWEPGAKYRLTVDSASVYNIYGLFNKPLTSEFTVKKQEDYSALFFNILGLDGRPAVVELLNSSDKVSASAPVNGGGSAALEFVPPGAYYVRLFIDANGNGRWDTGNVKSGLQPEEVYYFPKKLNLRKNWDVEQSWNIYETALDLQKPLEIKQNKPPKTAKQREEEDRLRQEKEKNGHNHGEEEEDPYADPYQQWGYPTNY